MFAERLQYSIKSRIDATIFAKHNSNILNEIILAKR